MDWNTVTIRLVLRSLAIMMAVGVAGYAFAIHAWPTIDAETARRFPAAVLCVFGLMIGIASLIAGDFVHRCATGEAAPRPLVASLMILLIRALNAICEARMVYDAVEPGGSIRFIEWKRHPSGLSLTRGHLLHKFTVPVGRAEVPLLLVLVCGRRRVILPIAVLDFRPV